MTSHEFARQLLAGPDLTIVTPRVVEYSDDEEDNMWLPHVHEREGFIDGSETPVKILVISGYSTQWKSSTKGGK